MISGATRGAGGAALAAYMAAIGANEVIRPLEGRGLVAEGSREQVEELTRMGSHARTSQPLYHLHADPPPGRPWTPEERAEYWRMTEAELGLEGRPFAAVMHVKGGREHEHRVYLRVHASGKAIRLDHDHARREKLGRIFEHDRGDPFTKGAHNRAVIAFLDRERPDVAAAMRAAGLHEGPPARAPETPGQRAVRERREAKAVRGTLAARVLAAWAASDGQEAFASALADAGLRLARGDRKAIPVLVDATGKTHELTRLFAAHAKATGELVPDKAALAARIDVAVLTRAAELPASVPVAEPAAPDHAVDHKAAPAMDGAAAPAPEQAIPIPADQAPATVVPVALEAPDAMPAAGCRDGTQAASGGVAKPAGGGGGGGAASAARGQGHGDVQQAEAEASAVADLLDRLREQWDRAGTGAEISAAVAAFEAEAARIRDGIGAGHGDDRAASRGLAAYDRHDSADPRPGGTGRDHAGGPDGTAPGRAAQPDTGNPVCPDGAAGVPATHRGEGGQAVRRAAAQARLTAGLASAPEAMASLRRARQELDPAWRERRDAHVRLQEDRARIAGILSGHPHPDPGDRDPEARATRYAGRLSEGYRERRASAWAAQAEAIAALQRRSIGTRLCAAIGISTPEQRRVDTAVARALALTDDADARKPTPADYKSERANGEAHAYAAQRSTRDWERRPDVAHALELARLNAAVDAAASAGDPTVFRALRGGDPDAARAVIQEREEAERRRQEEQERRMGMRPGSPITPGAGSPGTKGPK